VSLPDRLIGGRYKITRKLAEGGMGEVFEAQHNLSKKKVALKILFPHIGKDEAARQRFLREVSAPAQIGHEGIVEVYDAGFDTEDGSLFVAMEFVDGEPLRDRLARGGVSLEQLLDWFEEMLDPLAAAHDAGIVHRDLKPENAMLAKKRDGSEVIKLLDFGIARDLDGSNSNVTHTGIAMGTPHYMAPEQAMSAKGVTAAADVYAMGVILYEALAGKPPFDGETASAIVVNACTKAHAPLSQIAPHVPAPVSAFVDRCLAKEPQGRPANAGQMLSELRQIRTRIGSGAMSSTLGMPAQSTGPMAMGGTPQPTPYPTPNPYQASPAPQMTPSGTAMLPAGTPPPGGYGTPPPMNSPVPHTNPGGGFGSPAPSGFGASQPGGAFGSNPSYATGVGAGYTPGPGGYTSAPAPQKKGGMAMGLVAALLVGGLVVVIVGIGGLALLLSGDDEDPTGRVQISTNTSGDLFIDNRPRGAATHGRTLDVAPGSHTFQIRENNVVVAEGTITVQEDANQTVTLARQQAQAGGGGQAMMPGNVQTLNGELRPGDSQGPDGKYYDTYTFNWTAGSRVVIDMDSSDVDTYLRLRMPSGREIYNDDRPGGGLNSRIDTTLTESGVHTLYATTFSSNSTGNYTVTLHGP